VLRRFRKLGQSESQLLGLMRLSGDWYWEQDVRGRVVSLLHRSTPQAGAETGPTEFPILGHTRWDLAGLGPVDMSWADFRQLMDNKKPFEKVRFLYTSAVGERLYFVSSGVARTDWRGQDLGYCGVSVNITDRCLNQNLRMAERQLLRGLMLGLPPERLLGGFCSELAGAMHRVCDVYCWMLVDPVDAQSPGRMQLIAHSEGALALTALESLNWPHDRDRLLEALPGACLEEPHDSPHQTPLGFLVAVPRNHAPLSEKDRIRFHDAGSLLMLVLERQHFERETQQFNSQLETRIAERTASLQQTNRELESFSYTVSHDLRAPLRAIDGFTNIILEDFEADLPPDAVQLLKRISNNASQMGKLIDGLLDFSRLLRNQPVQVEVNMRALVDQVCETLNTGSRADIQIGSLPDALGDPLWFTQVWMNLIDNALKFSGKKPNPRVTIEATSQDDGVRFSVADNGAGFDPAYRDKLFNVFERLHHKKDFDGTGVGLAIVKRIIERHGGFVYAESVLGEGARFGFFLPWSSLIVPSGAQAAQAQFKEGV
jgi:signal transduction histidine kinase